MTTSTRLAALAFTLFSTVAHAHGGGAGDETVTPLAQAQLPASIGSDAKALRVEFAPGAASRPHTHPGPVFVVVVCGTVESSLDDGPVHTYAAGEAWYEAPGQEHRVTRNPSKSEPAVLVAWLLSDGKVPLVKPLVAQ
ncbi:quercetin dioxygenase-like cupin family protein [Pseudomonas sp. TE3786]